MANVTLPGAGSPVDTRLLSNGNHVQQMGLNLGATDAERLVFDRGTIPRSEDPGVPVRPIPADLWRAGFSLSGSGIPSPNLTLIQTGAGMTVSQASGNLVIATGTTANSETIARSPRTFRGGLLKRFSMILSQRIANQTFRVELADLVGEALAYTINSATSVTVTFPVTNPFTTQHVGQFIRLSALSSVGIPGRYAIASVSGLTVTFTVAAWPASGSGTLTLYGRNAIWTEYSGTTATNALADAAREGWANGNTTLTIATTASPGHIAQLTTDTLSAAWSDGLAASAAALQWTERGNRVTNLPDDDTEMYLFIIVQNGSTAPASTTTMTMGFVQVEMQGRQKVRMASSDPSGATQALPVVARGTTPVSLATNTPTLAAGTALAGDVGLQVRANATGAASTHHLVSAASTNALNIKASAGRVLGWSFVNTTASFQYVKLHNTAGAPTAGAGVVQTIAIPPNGVNNCPPTLPGIAFATGIARTIVTGAPDADATATTAGSVVGDIFFA
jgi:hypothetical protein